MDQSIKALITEQLKKILVDMRISGIEPQVTYPTLDQYGDYTTNIAMIIAGKRKKNPMDIAEMVRKELVNASYISKIDVLAPGFLNIWLSEDLLFDGIKKALTMRDQFGTSALLSGKKVMIEFADPNPFKEFHIGHLRNIALGESLSRLYEAMGAEVWRVNYQGDVGLHVAKVLYALLQTLDVSPRPPRLGEAGSEAGKSQMSSLEKEPVEKKVKFLADAYVVGSKAYEESEAIKQEIAAINVKIYKKDPAVQELWEIGRRWSLEYFETIYKRVGTTYKKYYFESQTEDPGKEIVLSHVQDGIFEKDQGAIIFRGEKYGLHTRVFVTAQDYATYEAKDLALAEMKYTDFPYDISIIMTGEEQSSYFQVILRALSLIVPDLAAKTSHFSFGMVQLADRKMSSRTGEVVVAQSLFDEAKARLQKLFPNLDSSVAEAVAVGGVKYAMLMYSRDSAIQFSIDQSLSLEGNSGPYLQYTYARMRSVLDKSAEVSITSLITGGMIGKEAENVISELIHVEGSLEGEEAMLMRLIHRFPDIVVDSHIQFAPHILCSYLFALAARYNAFYQKHSILESDKKDFRLALTASVGTVLRNGLYLLGIDAPERI